eukprot:1161337-Pelagomonas_calceolata.AAC.5
MSQSPPRPRCQWKRKGRTTSWLLKPVSTILLKCDAVCKPSKEENPQQRNIWFLSMPMLDQASQPAGPWLWKCVYVCVPSPPSPQGCWLQGPLQGAAKPCKALTSKTLITTVHMKGQQRRETLPEVPTAVQLHASNPLQRQEVVNCSHCNCVGMHRRGLAGVCAYEPIIEVCLIHVLCACMSMQVGRNRKTKCCGCGCLHTAMDVTSCSFQECLEYIEQG